MAQLQKPPYVYMNGKLVAWEDATIHASSEALIRGISVFEGIKAYWSHDGQELRLLALQEHFERLQRSAMLQYLPFEMSYADFRHACLTLVKALMTPERDQWLRPTIFSVEGQWGEFTITDLVITSYHQDKKRPAPIAVGVSTWQRPADTALPARIKSPANYQIGRLARIEGRRHGFNDMILLNPANRVAEATGSCVVMVRAGTVVTPPTHEGCLESITVRIIEGLCRSLSIPFERRPIERTELLVADEIFLAGTLAELVRVSRFEGRSFSDSAPTLDKIADAFWACVRGESTHASVQLTPVQ
jgi:branched-chain amino acid aminotransferase